MGKPNDLVWDQVCFGASLFDPLGRAFQLPGLRKTFRRPAENSPVSVVPHPQKLPAKASAQAPVASLPSELLAIIAAQHLCADLDAPLAASVCSSFNEVFKGQWPEWEDVRAPGAALQGLLPSIVPVAGGHALLVQQLGGRNLTEFQPCWAFDTAEEREQNPQVYHSASPLPSASSTGALTSPRPSWNRPRRSSLSDGMCVALSCLWVCAAWPTRPL